MEVNKDAENVSESERERIANVIEQTRPANIATKLEKTLRSIGVHVDVGKHNMVVNDRGVMRQQTKHKIQLKNPTEYERSVFDIIGDQLNRRVGAYNNQIQITTFSN